MQNSIVCGVDGSPDSHAALAVAAELAEGLGARLVLAHVTDHVPAYTAVGPIAAMSRPAPVGGDRRADEEAADMIVVGSRGRGAFKAAFLGSVSSDLIGVARCPVLVVPEGVRGS